MLKAGVRCGLEKKNIYIYIYILVTDRCVHLIMI